MIFLVLILLVLKEFLFFRIRCFAYRSYTIKHSYNGYYCRCFTCRTNQFENSLAATLGTSVGGVVTAVLASLSTNIEGKKLAFASCIFNFGIAFLIVLIFPYFIHFLNFLSIVLNIEDIALKVALFHTLFNLIGVVLFHSLLLKLFFF